MTPIGLMDHESPYKTVAVHTAYYSTFHHFAATCSIPAYFYTDPTYSAAYYYTAHYTPVRVRSDSHGGKHEENEE